MSKEINKFYKKLSKANKEDFISMSVEGDEIVIPSDAKGKVNLPEGYSVVNNLVFKGGNKIGRIAYKTPEKEEEIKTTEEEIEEGLDLDESTEEIEDDLDFDIEEPKASKGGILNSIKAAKKDDEAEEEEIEDDLDFDDDDYDIDLEGTDESEKSEDEELTRVVNEAVKKSNPNLEIKFDDEEDEVEEKEERSISESTNVFEIAQEIANINPDATIGFGDPDVDPCCNSRIFSSVKVEDLKLPEGFYYNEKNGVTNKHNTKSGAYCAFDVEDIKNAEMDNVLILAPESEDVELETIEAKERRHPIKRFFQKIAYAVGRFFKKGKKIKEAKKDNKEEKEVKVTPKTEENDSKKEEKSSEKVSKLSEKNNELEKEIDLLNQLTEQLKKENEELRDKLHGVDLKPVTGPSEKRYDASVTPDDTVVTSSVRPVTTPVDPVITSSVAEPTPVVKKDQPRKFEFTSVKDTRAKFEEYDKPEEEFKELESQVKYYEEFLSEHDLSHDADKEMKQRMTDKLNTLKTKYEALKAKKEDKASSSELREEKLAYYTQTAMGIDKAIDKIEKTRKLKILQAELEGKTIVNLGLAEERKIDEAKAELRALKAECIARKNAEMKYYNDIAARMTLALKR